MANKVAKKSETNALHTLSFPLLGLILSLLCGRTLRLRRGRQRERGTSGRCLLSPAAGCSARPPRHVRLIPVCPARLLDHLIRQEEQRWRDRDPERLGRLEVDDQLEFYGLLHRQVGGLGAFQDLVYVRGSTPEQIPNAYAIGHEPASLDIL